MHTRFSNGLRSRNEEQRQRTAAELAQYVRSELRELPPLAQASFIDKCNHDLFELLNSSDLADRRGAALAIVAMLSCDSRDISEANITRYVNYLRKLRDHFEPSLAELVAWALAEVAVSAPPGVIPTEIVETELNKAMEWLAEERQNEGKRLAAVHAMRELALHTPTLFYQQCPSFFEVVFCGIRDSKPHLRELTALALRAAFKVTAEREVSRKERDRAPHWYAECFAQLDIPYEERADREKRLSRDDWFHGNFLLIREFLICSNIEDEKVRQEMDEISTQQQEYERSTSSAQLGNKSSSLAVMTASSGTSASSASASAIASVSGVAAGLAALGLGQLDGRPLHLVESRACKQLLADRFDKISEMVLSHTPSRIIHIIQVLQQILPRLAAFNPAQFCYTPPSGSQTSFMDRTLHYLLNCIRKEREKARAFRAIGLLALGVVPQCGIENYLAEVIPYIQQNLIMTGSGSTSSQRRRTAPLCDTDVYLCVSNLTQAAHEAFLFKYNGQLKDILECMLAGGLSPSLTEALRRVAQQIPSLKKEIRDGLLKMLSRVLMGRPLRHPGAPSGSSVMRESTTSLQEQDITGLVLALKTLGDFDFEGHSLMNFVRHTADQCLVSEHREVRLEAVRTCSRLLTPLLASLASPLGSAGEPDGALVGVSASTSAVTSVADVLAKLLMTGISDPVPEIRVCVLSSLDERFDAQLAQVDHLEVLFVALHDEVFEIRELAIRAVGRLAAVNPAYVQPALRNLLLQLLTELELSGFGRSREQAARALSSLIATAPRFIQPYAEPLLVSLVPKLESGVLVSALAVGLLGAVGELAKVAGTALRPWVRRLFPVVMAAMDDSVSLAKREMAVWCLGQLIANTGFVFQPYEEHPQVLERLLNMLKSEHARGIRREVLRVLGLLGALDPFRWKVLIGEVDAVGDTGLAVSVHEVRERKEVDMSQAELLVNLSWVALDEYFPASALAALMRILRDKSMQDRWQEVVQGISYIFKSLSSMSDKYLAQVLPEYMNVMGYAELDSTVRMFMFRELGTIISIVKIYIKQFLPRIMLLISTHWERQLQMPAGERADERRLQLVTLINLLELIVLSIGHEFKNHLASVLPQIVALLHHDPTESKEPTLIMLRTITYFGASMDQYLHMIVPAVARILDLGETSVNVKQQALETLACISCTVDLTELASTVVHSVIRLLSRQPAVSELHEAAMDVLTALLLQSGRRFLVFVPLVTRTMQRYKVQHNKFQLTLNKIIKGTMLVEDHSRDTLLRRFKERGQRTRVAPPSGIGEQNIDDLSLQRAWQSNRMVSRDDWLQWLRNFSISLLKSSPSPAIRACRFLAQNYPPLAVELFNAAFVSCWTKLLDSQQDELIGTLESALHSDVPEISQMLLNLAEFMEHCDKGPLPINLNIVSERAIKNRAFAKALHYKEQKFSMCITHEVLESLIFINNKLGLFEAAFGVLRFASKNLKESIRNEETWLEKLHEWNKALELYEKKVEQQSKQPNGPDAHVYVGQMRCLEALGEWHKLSQLCAKHYSTQKDSIISTSMADESPLDNRRKVALMGANAAWCLGEWTQLRNYMSAVPKNTYDGAFFRAVLSIHEEDFEVAQNFIDQARDMLDADLSALVGESYSRAYSAMVSAQTLSELEEVIQYKLVSDKREVLRETWRQRLLSCQRELDDWRRILQVRSLVMTPQEDVETWLKFASLCRKSDCLNLSYHTLQRLLGGVDPAAHQGQSDLPIVTERSEILLSYCKHLWKSGQRQEAVKRLTELNDKVLGPDTTFILEERLDLSARRLMAKCCVKLGEWRDIIGFDHIGPDYVDAKSDLVINYFRTATDLCPKMQKAWAKWGLSNYECLIRQKEEYQDLVRAESEEKSHAASSASNNGGVKENAAALRKHSSAPENSARELRKQQLVQNIRRFSVPAVKGFVQSIGLSVKGNLQDSLRLINLLFDFGAVRETREALHDDLFKINLENWLQVIQAMLARIDTTREYVSVLIVDLLINVAKHHPQAMINPLILAFKSGGTDRRRFFANKVLYSMEEHAPRLVSEGFLLNEELIRLAITLAEMWHEGLEEASRVYFGQRDIKGMFSILNPLHELMERQPETLKEISFHQEFARDFAECREFWQRYHRTLQLKELNQCWDMYYHLFKRLAKQVPGVTQLELIYCSPRLDEYGEDWELAVPGTYEPHKPIVALKGVKPVLKMINSKQRPRVVNMKGGDGQQYNFLLKGHEDIRQDERVMQLFGLTNSLLMNNPHTFRRNLTIQRMSVIPLSTNTGLIGWVPNSDTLHALIKDFRERKKIMLNFEHRIMMRFAPDFEHLTLMQKTETFEQGIQQAQGDDLALILWFKSPSSEAWFERRINYIRSLATMSMVGYILGLGDRHPSNMMLDRETGKIVHIDFGDCFEVAMLRDKFPEQVPFRLTRMLIKAMEVTGIDGTFRQTCEQVMSLLRDNRHSLMAVLEAFVYDPLLQWVLFDYKREIGDNKKRMVAFRRQLNQEAGVGSAVSVTNSDGVNPWRHHLVNGPWFGCYDKSKQLRRRTKSGHLVVDRKGMLGYIFSARPPQTATANGSSNSGAANDAISCPSNSEQFTDLLESASVNSKAVAMMRRVKDKLQGHEMSDAASSPTSLGGGVGGGVNGSIDTSGTSSAQSLSVSAQVEQLIEQATDNRNLCQMYIGWCPFW